MKVEKSGSLMGISIIKNESGMYPTAYFRFKNGIFSVSIYNDVTLSSIIEKHNIGVANMGVKLSYTDYNKMIYFDCYIWDCEENILQDMITELDKDTKEFINNLLKDVQPNCRIDNIGFSLDMNSLCVVDDAPANFKKENNFNNDWMIPDFYKKLLEDAKVYLSEKVIVKYFDTWSNEWWNGPQNYGQISQIGKYFKDSGFGDYDFSFEDDTFKNREMIWDENTIIDLDGNNENGIHISCCLKDIGMFKGIIDSKAVNSGISTDVEKLLNIKYTTHQEYLEKYPHCSIHLISVKKILDHFNEYEKMINARYQSILQESEEMINARYQSILQESEEIKEEKFHKDNELPF